MEWHITGAGGFIGSHVAWHLINQGEKVVVYGTKAPTDPFRLNAWQSAAEHKFLDLRHEIPDFTSADRVLHFAADMGGVGYFTAHDYKPFINNARMTFNVLDAVHRYGTPRTFLAASACAYPIVFQQSLRTSKPLAEWMLDSGTPDQMYGREKLNMVMLAERSAVDVRVGLLHTIYGIGQESEGERVKFPVAAVKKILQARDTGVVDCWGTGEQLRSYLYIDDAVRKILAVVNGENRKPVNIGFAGNISCIDVLRLCADIVGIDPEYVFSTDKPSGVVNRDCNNELFDSLYGNMDTVGYRDGFSRLINWLG